MASVSDGYTAVEGFLVAAQTRANATAMLAAAAARGIAGGVRPLSMLGVLVSCCYCGFWVAVLFAFGFLAARYYVDNGGSIALQQRRHVAPHDLQLFVCDPHTTAYTRPAARRARFRRRLTVLTSHGVACRYYARRWVAPTGATGARVQEMMKVLTGPLYIHIRAT